MRSGMSHNSINFSMKFLQEENTPKLLEKSNLEWYGKVVTTAPLGAALLPPSPTVLIKFCVWKNYD